VLCDGRFGVLARFVLALFFVCCFAFCFVGCWVSVLVLF